MSSGGRSGGIIGPAAGVSCWGGGGGLLATGCVIPDSTFAGAHLLAAELLLPLLSETTSRAAAAAAAVVAEGPRPSFPAKFEREAFDLLSQLHAVSAGSEGLA